MEIAHFASIMVASYMSVFSYYVTISIRSQSFCVRACTEMPGNCNNLQCALIILKSSTVLLHVDLG